MYQGSRVFRYISCQERIDEYDQKFIADLAEQHKEFMKNIEESLECYAEYIGKEFYDCNSRIQRRIVHILAQKYGLYSRRVPKIVHLEWCLEECDPRCRAHKLIDDITYYHTYDEFLTCVLKLIHTGEPILIRVWS